MIITPTNIKSNFTIMEPKGPNQESTHPKNANCIPTNARMMESMPAMNKKKPDANNMLICDRLMFFGIFLDFLQNY